MGSVTDDDVMTPEEVAAMLKVPEGTIYELTRKRYGRRHGGLTLPKFRAGRELRFRREDVLKWIEQLIQLER